MSRRQERINHLIRAEISELLVRQVKDPRLEGLISITRVDTAPDLSAAKVFVSIMDSCQEEEEEVLQTLNAAAGFFRHELKNHLVLYRIPVLRFKIDNTIAEADRILRLIKQVGS